MPTQTFDGQADGATLIAAPAAGCFIRVLGGELSSPSAIVTVSLKSDTTVIWETKVMGATPFAASMNVDKERTVDCAPGQALKLGASAGAVSGQLEYVIYGLDNRQLFVS
jgi:hypothetical protein